MYNFAKDMGTVAGITLVSRGEILSRPQQSGYSLEFSTVSCVGGVETSEQIQGIKSFPHINKDNKSLV